MAWYFVGAISLVVLAIAWRTGSLEKTAIAAGVASAIWLMTSSGSFPWATYWVLPGIIAYYRRSVLFGETV